LALAAALFVTTATGGPLVIVVEAAFVGWIAIATLIWSGHDSHDPVDIGGRSSYSAGDTA
jgi:hypothetical protein